MVAAVAAYVMAVSATASAAAETTTVTTTATTTISETAKLPLTRSPQPQRLTSICSEVWETLCLSTNVQ